MGGKGGTEVESLSLHNHLACWTADVPRAQCPAHLSVQFRADNWPTDSCTCTSHFPSLVVYTFLVSQLPSPWV